MVDDKAEIGRAALAKALDMARKHAGPATAAAVIVPLALAATPAHATVALQVTAPTASNTVSRGTGGVMLYNYDFVNNGPPVTEVVLPEKALGEYLSNGSGSYFGFNVTGWTIAESLKSPVSAPTFKDGSSAAAYIVLSASSSDFDIFSGEALSFTLESNIGTYVSANASVVVNGSVVTVDPPSPAPAPEPASLSILGAATAGVAAFRRKRKKR
jgi:hypothetical protein